MNLLHAPPFDNTHSNRELPRVIREFHALRATTIDARRFPIIAAHWPGIFVVNGRMAVNDDSPLSRMFWDAYLWREETGTVDEWEKRVLSEVQK